MPKITASSIKKYPLVYFYGVHKPALLNEALINERIPKGKAKIPCVRFLTSRNIIYYTSLSQK